MLAAATTPSPRKSFVSLSSSSRNSGPLDKKILSRDHVDFIRIMKDGSILVVNWKDFFVGKLTKTMKASCPKGVKSVHCDELMEDLKVALAEMSTK